ncbi:putative quinol monooxygenase [Allosphingosinicella indica]|uniref:Quinol monooxygenase YgiN n=1 Tax=Allosphingosinicella indica TaxID=941907 RepID=A0A1X7G1T5_9SPHN|nr:putative quinol monooxygenase [Allosphingosinicella indica]SMF62481.1 Quinol monooxygenase YgiN [Allosphingosinicella indica]
MTTTRRQVMAVGAGAALLAAAPAWAADVANGSRYGLIGQMLAKPGERDALAAILLEGTAAMPGCLSYVVALDTKNPDALWITEVWDSKDSHAASLKLPAVQAAIAKARSIITGFGHRFETTPLGGAGLAR